MKRFFVLTILIVLVLGNVFATDFILEPGFGFVHFGGKNVVRERQDKSKSTMFNFDLTFEGELDNNMIIYDVFSLGLPRKIRERNVATGRFESSKANKGFLLANTIGLGYAFHFGNNYRLALGVGGQSEVLTYKFDSDISGFRETIGVALLFDLGYMFSDTFGISLSSRPTFNFYSAEKSSGLPIKEGGHFIFDVGAELNCIIKF